MLEKTIHESNSKLKFALIGSAGYISDRHFKAISDIGGELIAHTDPHDSVGKIDQFYPNAAFFTEFERFDRHLYRLRENKDRAVNYISICSPNHLHDAHIRFALRVGADAICEKPIILNPWNLDSLEKLEKESNNKVYSILQLRHHPQLIKLKQRIESAATSDRFKVTLTYITPRGRWYGYSWKGDNAKSGGIITNIGIHLFDTLGWLFGDLKSQAMHLSELSKAAGFCEYHRADVSWYLSVDPNDLNVTSNSNIPVRCLDIGDERIDFSQGFTDLHRQSYQAIISNKGFRIQDARPSIECCYMLRTSKPNPDFGFRHPIIKEYVTVKEVFSYIKPEQIK